MSDNILSIIENFNPKNKIQYLLRRAIQVQSEFETYQHISSDALKKEQLEFLRLAKEHYSLYLEVVNNVSLEHLDEQFCRIRTEIRLFHSEYQMNSMVEENVKDLNAQLEIFKMLVEAKQKYGTLKPFDELMHDEKALMEMFT